MSKTPLSKNTVLDSILDSRCGVLEVGQSLDSGVQKSVFTWLSSCPNVGQRFGHPGQEPPKGVCVQRVQVSSNTWTLDSTTGPVYLMNENRQRLARGEVMQEGEIQSGVKRDERGRFLPGMTSMSPGRPKGQRHKLSSNFLEDLALFWQQEGGDILRRVAADDPSTVLRVVASLVPKELALRLEAGADGSAGIVINLLGVAPAVALSELDITPDLMEESSTPEGSIDAHIGPLSDHISDE